MSKSLCYIHLVGGGRSAGDTAKIPSESRMLKAKTKIRRVK